VALESEAVPPLIDKLKSEGVKVPEADPDAIEVKTCSLNVIFKEPLSLSLIFVDVIIGPEEEEEEN
jgi:hypothetical protein